MFDSGDSDADSRDSNDYYDTNSDDEIQTEDVHTKNCKSTSPKTVSHKQRGQLLAKSMNNRVVIDESDPTRS